MAFEAHPTPQKIEAVAELDVLFKQAKGLYLADFTGLNVEEVNELRRNFRQQQVFYKVVKNTLIKQACQNSGYTALLPFLEGPTALAIGLQDPVLPARLISDFVKNREKKSPVIKAGMLENSFIGPDQIAALKDIPPREVLLSQILFLLSAPLSNFVGTLNEIVRSFLGVLQAIIEKKQAGGEP